VPAKHRAAASCGNPGLGLSHRGDSRWRVPWRSAGRRARLSVRSRCRASGNWRNNAPFGASPPFFVSLLTGSFFRVVVASKARAQRSAARTILLIRPRTQCGGGGPPEGRWRGHAELRLAASPSPLPPRYARSPLPAARGWTKYARHCERQRSNPGRLAREVRGDLMVRRAAEKLAMAQSPPIPRSMQNIVNQAVG
jgi:hypothetical protein